MKYGHLGKLKKALVSVLSVAMVLQAVAPAYAYGAEEVTEEVVEEAAVEEAAQETAEEVTEEVTGSEEEAVAEETQAAEEEAAQEISEEEEVEAEEADDTEAIGTSIKYLDLSSGLSSADYATYCTKTNTNSAASTGTGRGNANSYTYDGVTYGGSTTGTGIKMDSKGTFKITLSAVSDLYIFPCATNIANTSVKGYTGAFTGGSNTGAYKISNVAAGECTIEKGGSEYTISGILIVPHTVDVNIYGEKTATLNTNFGVTDTTAMTTKTAGDLKTYIEGLSAYSGYTATVYKCGDKTKSDHSTETLVAMADTDTLLDGSTYDVKLETASASAHAISSKVVVVDGDNTYQYLNPGTVTLGKSKAENGDQVTVTVTENPGYTLKDVTVVSNNDGGSSIKETKSFTMGDYDVEVKATFEGTKYNITLLAPAGYAPSTPKEACSSNIYADYGAGRELSCGFIGVNYNEEEYMIKEVKVTYTDGGETKSVTVTESSDKPTFDGVIYNHSYCFPMPASNVYAQVTYAAAEVEVKVASGVGDEGTLSDATDVTVSKKATVGDLAKAYAYTQKYYGSAAVKTVYKGTDRTTEANPTDTVEEGANYVVQWKDVSDESSFVFTDVAKYMGLMEDVGTGKNSLGRELKTATLGDGTTVTQWSSGANINSTNGFKYGIYTFGKGARIAGSDAFAVAINNSNSDVTFTAPANGTMKLYARIDSSKTTATVAVKKGSDAVGLYLNDSTEAASSVTVTYGGGSYTGTYTDADCVSFEVEKDAEYTIPTAAIRIYAIQFEEKSYTITTKNATDADGNVLAKLYLVDDNVTTALEGDEVIFDIKDVAEGYTPVYGSCASLKILVNGEEIEAGVYAIGETPYHYYFEMPGKDTEVTLNLQKIPYMINTTGDATVSFNGTLPGYGSEAATINDPISFTVEPNEGKKVTKVSVAEKESGNAVELTETDGVYSFKMPAKEVMITVDTENIMYKITTAVYGEENGLSEFVIAKGANYVTESCKYGNVADDTKISVLVEAKDGYVIKSVKANDEDVTALVDHSFEMPAKDVTVTVEVAKKEFSIVRSGYAVAEGKVTVTDESDTEVSSIAWGEKVYVKVEPYEGYKLSSLSVAGTNITITPAAAEEDEKFGPIPVGSYETLNSAGDIKVVATFAKVDYAITTAADGTEAAKAGTVSVKKAGSDAATANKGDTIEVCPVSVPAGMHLSTVVVTNKKTGATVPTTNTTEETATGTGITKASFTMPAAEVLITYEYKGMEYAINVSPVDGEAAADASVTTSIKVNGKKAGQASAGDTVTVSANSSVAGTYVDEIIVSQVDGESVFSIKPGEEFTMGAGQVYLQPVCKYTLYTVNGTATIDGVTGWSGINEYTIKVLPNHSWDGAYDCWGSTARIADDVYAYVWSGNIKDGYAFKDVTVTDADTKELIATYPTIDGDIRFTAPARNILISVNLQKIHTITVTAPTNGSLSVKAGSTEVTTALSGTELTVTATPDEGYKLKQITFTPAGGSATTATESPASYTVDGDVTIAAEFEEETATESVSYKWDFQNDYGKTDDTNYSIQNKTGEISDIYVDATSGKFATRDSGDAQINNGTKYYIPVTGYARGDVTATFTFYTGTNYINTTVAGTALTTNPQTVTLSKTDLVTVEGKEGYYIPVQVTGSCYIYSIEIGYTAAEGTTEALKSRTATNPDATYTVTFDANGGKFSDGNATKTVKGTSGTALSISENPAKDGYTFKGWAESAAATAAAALPTTITKTITYYAVYDKASSDDDSGKDDPGKEESVSYNVVIAASENGSVTADKATAVKGETVTLSANAAEGYVFDSYNVTAADSSAVAVSGNSFTMPAADVTVSANFLAKEEEKKAINDSDLEEAVEIKDGTITLPEKYDYVSAAETVDDAALLDQFLFTDNEAAVTKTGKKAPTTAEYAIAIDFGSAAKAQYNGGAKIVPTAKVYTVEHVSGNKVLTPVTAVYTVKFKNNVNASVDVNGKRLSSIAAKKLPTVTVTFKDKDLKKTDKGLTAYFDIYPTNIDKAVITLKKDVTIKSGKAIKGGNIKSAILTLGKKAKINNKKDLGSITLTNTETGETFTETVASGFKGVVVTSAGKYTATLTSSGTGNYYGSVTSAAFGVSFK